jgi:hypothetical protein
MRPYAQRYLMGLNEYLDDPFNRIDALSLLFVAVSVVRVLAGAESGITALFSAVGTLLLWVRAHDALRPTPHSRPAHTSTCCPRLLFSCETLHANALRSCS